MGRPDAFTFSGLLITDWMAGINPMINDVAYHVREPEEQGGPEDRIEARDKERIEKIKEVVKCRFEDRGNPNMLKKFAFLMKLIAKKIRVEYIFEPYVCPGCGSEKEDASDEVAQNGIAIYLSTRDIINLTPEAIFLLCTPDWLIRDKIGEIFAPYAVFVKVSLTVDLYDDVKLVSETKRLEINSDNSMFIDLEGNFDMDDFLTSVRLHLGITDRDMTYHLNLEPENPIIELPRLKSTTEIHDDGLTELSYQEYKPENLLRLAEWQKEMVENDRISTKAKVKTIIGNTLYMV